jgi:hypothetical protein
MPIELAGITLNKIHKLATLESAGFAGHRIPGLAGTVFQDTGRHSTRLLVEGIYYGEKAKEDLEKLRDVYKKREEADFLAEIVGQAYFSQVIIDRLEVLERAGEPEQFSFRMVLAEYVPPPEPEAALGLPGVDDLLSLDALDFMDMLSLPDLLSVPGFGDPTPPLNDALEGIGSAMDGATQPAEAFGALFEGSGSLTNQVDAQVDASAVSNLTNDQLNILGDAGNDTTSTLSQSETQLQDVQSHAAGIEPPVINPGPQLEQGFASVQNELPTNSSAILGGIDGEMDEFFSGLEQDLNSPFGDVLDNFKSLGRLGLSGSDSPSAPPEGELRSLVAPARNPAIFPQGRNTGLIASELDAILEMIPDPLDAVALIRMVHGKLASLSRERVPLQNIPVYDELRDKLETAITWLESDGDGITAHFVQSLTSFENYIGSRVRGQNVDPIRQLIATLEKETDFDELQRLLTGIPQRLNQLAAAVNSGSLVGQAGAISDLQAMVIALRVIAADLKLKWIDTTGKDLMERYSLLNETLEERMAELILLGAPSPDLSLIGLIAQPLNALFETLGIQAFISGIQSFSNTVGGLIEKLNLANIGDTVGDVVNRATQAIQVFSNLLVNITVEFSKLINRVEQAIESIGVAELVDQLKGVLDAFNQQVVEGLNRLFGPVRAFLQEAFDKINELITAFDPGIILDEVKKILQKLTDILGNEELKNTVAGIRGTLEGVNDTLLTFRFNPVTDHVVTGIGAVKTVFGIAGSIPLPDSVAEEVKSALGKLPSGAHMRTITGNLTGGLDDMIEQGPKPVLVAIKDKPGELIALVEQYDPVKLLGDKLSEPYQAFVTEIEKLKPTVIFQPVQAELDKLMDKVKEQLDPTQIFVHLEEPFQALMTTLDALDPNPLIQPLQEKLSAGIRAITSRLPLDATDEIFEVVNGVATKIRTAIESMQKVREGIMKINLRIAGLAQSEDQLRNWGNDVSAKLASVSNFAPVATALQAVDTALGTVEAAALRDAVFPPMDALIARITNIQPQNALVAMVQAKRGFTDSAMQNLPDSVEKQALLALLQDLNPMDSLFSQSLGGLHDLAQDWTSRREQLEIFFEDWQRNFFSANGPLALYRRPGMTLQELRNHMMETITSQLTNAIAPVFRVIDHIQVFIAAILSEMENLILRLETQVLGLLSITDALNGLRVAVQSIVDQLNALDITFIAREIEEVFGAVKAQLEAINPVEIGKALKTAFDNLIDAIDPVNLLGIAALDGKHQELVELLRERDPKVLITDKLQPEYDKIVDFLKLFDIKVIVETFLIRVEGLQVHLDEELERVISAYEEMIGAIPGPLSGSLGVSFSVSSN